jgi:hypothetical protein
LEKRGKKDGGVKGTGIRNSGIKVNRGSKELRHGNPHCRNCEFEKRRHKNSKSGKPKLQNSGHDCGIPEWKRGNKENQTVEGWNSAIPKKMRGNKQPTRRCEFGIPQSKCSAEAKKQHMAGRIFAIPD